MNLNVCPLGYPCDKPQDCVRFGYGLDEAALNAAQNSGLTIDMTDGSPMLELCSGPLAHGLNDQAQAALGSHPVLGKEGFEVAVGQVERLLPSLERFASFVGSCSCNAQTENVNQEERMYGS